MAVPPLARPAFLAVPLVSALVLAAGIAGLVPGLAAVAAGAGLASVFAAAVLWRTALAIHRDSGVFAACRGAGFIGCGALGLALTCGILLWYPPGVAFWAPGGIVVSGAFFVLGTMLLPGAATTITTRLRRLFDGLGLGVSIGFAAYLLTPMPDTPYSALACTFVTATAISMVIVIVLRARVHRGAALRCGAGVVMALIAVCIIANLVLSHIGGWLPPFFALFVVAGLTLSAEGGSRNDDPGRPKPAGPDQYLSSYPLLAVPAAVGVGAAAFHLLTVGDFDRFAIVLGLSMVALLTMRELLVVKDIRQYTRRLMTKEAHFRSLVAGATDLTLVLDDRLTIKWQSPAAARLFGLADSEVVGRTFLELIHPDDAPGARAGIEALLEGEHHDGPPALLNARLRDGHGIWRDTESTVADQRGVPEVAALVVHVRDVGERRHLERTLHRLSYTDQLTGLANRRALMRDLLEFRRRAGQQGTLLVIDLHGLAETNDSRGRETGDAVLIEVGRRIKALLGADDVPARLGGDEFAVLTTDGAVLAYALATRIVTALVEPYQLPGAIVQLHTSIGLAELAGGKDSDEVLRHADLARKRSRQLGTDRVEWYDTDVEIQLHRRMDLERELLGAADRGELDLVFQPVTSLRDRRPAGVEALLRWRHPRLGTILPVELLPIARAVGCAAELDEWVLDAACRHLAGWSPGDAWLSVNVAPRELLTARFPEHVAEILARHAIAPERLVVEVQETWVAEDVPAIVAALAALRKLGVRAALDDFGAGSASLAHLRRLPVDMLKLDQTLVNQPPQPGTTPAVIDVVVSLGRRLGLEIVAKGLETADQIERAAQAGCHYGQGFALGRPAPAERTEAYLENHRA
ncbi:putative bifunctional diguanylate cyclase/phosphodiesterase [Symbioplanes lichenis]|uniref:putative bifunctional diguanylate cyclase/phosphodiesterase n=1 Tax=Symbioplanes lichenis TaxID=1629072 RepID=UPI0027397379|nr:EAL domain-containing protein [Actinoplanes lichenis]